ncbi:MAG TPA: TIR domain-containing protein [Acholeplasmataceae bacterium]|nr:hypothetical protein [Acholeplasmataceae bacterium]HPX72210.1 TIR domain-containing protein [Acholeplasmataceae bacterium]
MTKKRAFISFDYENDKKLKRELIGQSKKADSPFEIVDVSAKESYDPYWEEDAREKIKSSDVMIVICGYNTDTADGVSAELSIAQEENIPYFFLWGRKNKLVTKPKGALDSDKIYGWNKGSLKLLLSGKR